MKIGLLTNVGRMPAMGNVWEKYKMWENIKISHFSHQTKLLMKTNIQSKITLYYGLYKYERA